MLAFFRFQEAAMAKAGGKVKKNRVVVV